MTHLPTSTPPAAIVDADVDAAGNPNGLLTGNDVYEVITAKLDLVQMALRQNNIKDAQRMFKQASDFYTRYLSRMEQSMIAGLYLAFNDIKELLNAATFCADNPAAVDAVDADNPAEPLPVASGPSQEAVEAARSIYMHLGMMPNAHTGRLEVQAFTALDRDELPGMLQTLIDKSVQKINAEHFEFWGNLAGILDSGIPDTDENGEGDPALEDPLSVLIAAARYLITNGKVVKTEKRLQHLDTLQAAIDKAAQQAREQEREACAKLCEALVGDMQVSCRANYMRMAAGKIRERKTP